MFGGTRSGELEQIDPNSIGQGRGYAEAFLTSKAKVIMASCTSDDESPDNSFFAKGFRYMLKKAREAPVTHTEIEAHIKKLGANRFYRQLPNAQRWHGSESDFIFFPPKKP